MKNKNKLAVRVMAWILAGLMVLGAVYFTVAAIVETVREKEALEHSEDDGHDHEGHNH